MGSFFVVFKKEGMSYTLVITHRCNSITTILLKMRINAEP